MRARAYGGLGFRVRVSESSLYSLLIPSNYPPVTRRSILRPAMCIDVVMWLCLWLWLMCHRLGRREADGVADAPL